MSLLTFLIISILFVFIVGLCVGSFLNVVILRAFSNESICFPGSKCPSCQKPLKWYHNIPVLSYLILKGKCAFCKDTINIQYPIIELITGLLFVAVFWRFQISINTIFMLIFTSLFIVLAVTDIKEKVVFDFHTYALVAAGIIYNVFNIGHFYLGDKVFYLCGFSIAVNNSLIAAILGILLGIVVMEIFARFGYLVAGTRAFGEGDTYIAAGLGSIFGWKYLITVLAYAFIIQIVFTIPVFIKKLWTNKDYKTLLSLFLFFIMVFLIKWVEKSMFNIIIFSSLTLLLCFMGVYICRRILGGIKETQNMTYLPFGPAMVFSGLFVMFIL
ncbi:MAG: prepilin peptidase [Candidatus Gastranaerophilales bacterium]|nr:prepilin peptidase [Candidatus Gastranaerophilales bacterium]